MVVSLVLDQKAVLSWILRIAALGLLAVTSVGLLSLNLKSAEDRD